MAELDIADPTCRRFYLYYVRIRYNYHCYVILNATLLMSMSPEYVERNNGVVHLLGAHAHAY